MKTNTEQDFWAKVDKDGPMPDFTDPLVRLTEADGNCWVWTGGVDKDGYGRFSMRGKAIRAHRFSVSAPTGSVVDHLCRVPSCVRSNHLEVVTTAQNNARGASPSGRNSRKKNCIRLHPLFGENLLIDNRGKRQCRTCRNDRAAARERLVRERNRKEYNARHRRYRANRKTLED